MTWNECHLNSFEDAGFFPDGNRVGAPRDLDCRPRRPWASMAVSGAFSRTKTACGGRFHRQEAGAGDVDSNGPAPRGLPEPRFSGVPQGAR